MPVNTNPQQYSQNWMTGMSGATEKIKAGINRMTVSPTQQAAAASGKWQQSVSSAAAKKAFEDGCNATTLEAYKRAAIDKGIANLQAGLQIGSERALRYAQKFLPQLAQITDTVNQMPSDTFEARVQKSVAQQRRVHELKGTFH